MRGRQLDYRGLKAPDPDWLTVLVAPVCPPAIALHFHAGLVSEDLRRAWCLEPPSGGVRLTDLLTQLYQLHLCGHVSHGPHALSQVLIADEAVLVFVKLPESLPELCGGSRTDAAEQSEVEIA